LAAVGVIANFLGVRAAPAANANPIVPASGARIAAEFGACLPYQRLQFKRHRVPHSVRQSTGRPTHRAKGRPQAGAPALKR
jgi:hypothetical protein